MGIGDLGLLGASYDTTGNWWELGGDMDLNGAVGIGDLGILGAGYDTSLTPPPPPLGGGGGMMMASYSLAADAGAGAAVVEGEFAPPDIRGRRDIAQSEPNVRIAWGAVPTAQTNVPPEQADKLPRVRTDLGAGPGGSVRTFISADETDAQGDQDIIDVLSLTALPNA